MKKVSYTKETEVLQACGFLMSHESFPMNVLSNGFLQLFQYR